MTDFKEIGRHNEVGPRRQMIIAISHVYTYLVSKHISIEFNVVRLAQGCY